MRAVRIEIGTYLLERLLKLPPDVRVASTTASDGYDAVGIVLVGDRFDEVPEGEQPPGCVIQYTERDPHVEFVPCAVRVNIYQAK